jgi:ATP-binding cassette subfamily C (CFTR/MRP) protein 1
MVELRSGSILIDGIDIAKLSRNAVRARINTIPQDSFFLPGTIRLNLDPNESVSIDEMVRALQDVQLWTVIKALGGVEAE